MNLHLAAAERDRGNAIGSHPVGVEAAVRDVEPRHKSDGANGLLRRRHARLVVGETKCLVVEMAVEGHGAGLTIGAPHPLRRIFEGRLDRLHDLSAKRRVVAPRLRTQRGRLGHDIGRAARLDDTHIARAPFAPLRHEAVPAVLDERRDGKRRDRDRRHSLFRRHARMTRHPFDGNVHAVAAGRTDRDLLDCAAVKIEGQLGSPQVGRLGKSCPIETDLFLDREEERQRRVRQFLLQNLKRCREHDCAASPVVGTEPRGGIAALHEAARHHGSRANADGDRIHVGHEEPPRARLCARKLDD